MASKDETTRASRSPMGTLEKRENGRYRVRYTDPDGRRVTAGTYASKQLAQAQLNRIQFSIESGDYSKRTASRIGDLDSKTATLRELAEHWRSTQVRGGQPLAITTLREYERLIVNVLSSIADSPVRSITPGQIEKWWRPEHLRAPNQASKAYKHLKTLMSFAVERNWIRESPCVIKGATSYRPATRPKAPTREQVKIMIETAAEPFDVVIALAAWAGFRKGEIFELRRKDVEFLEDQGETWTRVRIERAVTWDKKIAIVKVPKTEASIRTVTLPLFMTDLLKRHLATVAAFPEALLFEKRPGTNENWTTYQLRPKWEPVRAAAGFNGRFHALRNYALTEFGLVSPSLFELMKRGGHKDVAVAMRYQRDTGREIELMRRLPNG
jgi:integrase